MENVVLRPGGPQHRMIESRVGRTQRAETQRRRGEPRALAEPYDRDVRQPRTVFALVHPEPLEAGEEVVGEGRRPSVLVGEDEHADAARLAVARDGKDGPLDSGGRLAEGGADRRHHARRTAAQKRERDVEVRADDRADAAALGQLAPAPGDEAVEDVVRKPEPAEEPDR